MGKSFKEIAKQFIPPIFLSVTNCFHKKGKNEIINTLPKNDVVGDRLIVIGNGPSLNTSFDKYEKVLCVTDCLMVNESAMSPLYVAIKPSIYMLIDPKFYMDKGYESYRKTLESLAKALVEKTTWKMTLVMPHSSAHSYIVEQLKQNTNISELFFHNGLVKPKDMSMFDAWDKNLVCPPAQTVLNAAVWLSIYWGYKETYLIGADTSWHAQLQMDQETNELYTEDTHFFDNGAVYGKLYDTKKNRRPIKTRLHEELLAEATALKSYWDLREYADWKRVKIYNASECSWIDAFERKKLG